MSLSNNIAFILVEPVYRGNIGAAARVINNFGFKDLRLVGTIPQKEDHYLAVHSEDIMQSIKIYDNLSAALEGMDNVIALTRRSGKKKKTDIDAGQIGDFITTLDRGRTALVFGRETYGLTDEEVDLCPVRCLIPTDPAFPSLNLAQAVAIVAYELHRASDPDEGDEKLAGLEQINRTVGLVMTKLAGIGYFAAGDPARTEKQLKNVLLKGYTSEENLLFLDRMFQRIDVLFSKRNDIELNA